MKMRTTFKKLSPKFLIASVALLPVLTLHAASTQPYAQCLSNMSMSQAHGEMGADYFDNASTYMERFFGTILSSLPKNLESEIIKLAGVTAKDLQKLKAQVAEHGAVFDEVTEPIATEKLKVAHTTFYAYHPYDDRFIVLLTPEGRVSYVKVSEKGVLSEKATRKFSINDPIRNYYFSIHHDVKCKKNCDNYIWMVDTAPTTKVETAVVNPKDFPLLAAKELVGSKAQELARAVLEDEVKYGLAKIVGVEKAQKLAGRVVLPDVQDTSKYNREKFIQALKACERGLASYTKDKELLVQAIALLR